MSVSKKQYHSFIIMCSKVDHCGYTEKVVEDRQGNIIYFGYELHAQKVVNKLSKRLNNCDYWIKKVY